ncbi:MAG: MFS transporter [Chloroflexi bacterium]|nr:MFS transporter [Chloroflexota bacterium]
MASAADSTASSSPNKWLGLVAASAGVFLGTFDITVNVALPNITSSFGTDVQTVQWIIIFYVGSTTGLQLSLGSVADAYGLKRFYVIGLVVYTLAVLLISLAPTLSIVFGFRVLQAVGNGLILASAPALVTRAFPSEERGKALGLMAGLGTLGMLVGALGGGVLVDSFGWRAIFAVRVPLGLIAIGLALVTLREQPSGETRQGFDFRGAVTLFIGLASFILFLTLGGRLGWTAPAVLALALLSVASLTAFAYAESHAQRPVLDLALLRHRVLAPAFIAAYLIYMATFVNLFILPFFATDIMGVNAKTWGLLLMLTPVVITVSAPVGGWLSDRISPAYLTTAALAMMLGTVFSFTLLDADSTVFDVALRTAAMGVGMGLFQASNANLVMGNVPANRLATGGAIMTMSRNIGSVTSVAIISALFAARLDSHTITLTGQGIIGDAGSTQAFVLALRDAYRFATLLGGIAVLVSFTYWPWFVRKGGDVRPRSPTSG